MNRIFLLAIPAALGLAMLNGRSRLRAWSMEPMQAGADPMSYPPLTSEPARPLTNTAGSYNDNDVPILDIGASVPINAAGHGTRASEVMPDLPDGERLY